MGLLLVLILTFEYFNLSKQSTDQFIGAERSDILFSANEHALYVDAQGGNDRIYASSQADLLKGGDGHDMIFGSAPFYENVAIYYS